MNRALYYNRIFWNFVRSYFIILSDHISGRENGVITSYILKKSALSMLPVSEMLCGNQLAYGFCGV